MVTLTDDEKKLITNLRVLSKRSKSAPWYPKGVPAKDGKRTYRLQFPEEDLVILMRNHIEQLVDIIERSVDTVKQ